MWQAASIEVMMSAETNANLKICKSRRGLQQSSCNGKKLVVNSDIKIHFILSQIRFEPTFY